MIEQQNGGASAANRTPRPLRDRKFWVHLAIQALVTFALTPQPSDVWPWSGIPSMLSGPVLGPIAQVLLYGGIAVAFVGLLIQRYRFHLGLYVATAGAVAVALSAKMVFVIGFVFVCYEAFQISRHASHRRRSWFAALLVGSYATIIYSIVINRLLKPVLEGSARPWWKTLSTPTALVITVLVAVFVAASVSAFWQLGAARRRQAMRIRDLQARAELAALTERNRIAREMHDVVAHSLAVVIAQADGGRFAGKQNPQAALDALTTISSVGRDALGQMRGLLSLLHDDPNGPDPRDLGKLPGVESVARLIDEAESAGLTVTRRDVGQPQRLEDSKGLTVFRVVQECLTNALKHAGKTDVEVTFDWGVARPKWLVVQVSNAPGHPQVEQSGDGAGRGLEGIRSGRRCMGEGRRGAWTRRPGAGACGWRFRCSLGLCLTLPPRTRPRSPQSRSASPTTSTWSAPGLRWSWTLSRTSTWRGRPPTARRPWRRHRPCRSTWC
nr:histidine kinase [Corynebacterium lactis]